MLVKYFVWPNDTPNHIVLWSDVFLIADAFKIIKPPVVADLALSPEEICVILERQFENKIFLNGVLNARWANWVT